MPIQLEPGGRPIAGYELVRRLGRGGFGEVWEALAPGGVRVALKFIRLDGEHSGPERRALEAIRDIRHPHLLDVHFAAVVEDYFVIGMPLCDRSLKDRLEECGREGRPGLPVEELMGYMDELAEAVDYLNEPRHPSGDGRLIGVQHRDIKPHNIFVVGGSARLADFGLAKVLEESRAQHSGGISPLYAAPEVIQGEVSSRTDQYSLGVTYLQLRTGRLPFEGASPHRFLYAHVHEAPDLSSLPNSERAAVARALAKAPADRWPDCRSFVQAIRAHADTNRNGGTTDLELTPAGRPSNTAASTWPDSMLRPAPAPAPSSRVGDEVRAKPERGSRWLAVLGIVAALACVAAALFLSYRGNSPPAEPPVLPKVVEVEAEPPKPPVIPKVAEVEAEPPKPPVAPVLAVDDESKNDPKLAEKAHAVLKTYCYRCHGVKFEVPGLNVLDHDGLTAKRGPDEKPYLVAGDPIGSELWQRVGVEKDMPPSKQAKPTDAERQLIAAWIKAGAPFPVIATATRSPKSDNDVLLAIRDHLRKARDADRPHLRFFTLHNLYNNKTVSDADLRLARAGVAKLANSLSWKVDIVVPRAIDPDQLILAVDQRDLGWDLGDTWKVIQSKYPYGLTHDKDPNESTRSVAAEVESMAGTAVPHVRADWFVANASRPPLYHAILELPSRSDELKRILKVDTEADFLNDRIARAGFAESGVSGENRVVDRHDARHGAYWESYDFRRSDGPGNIFQRPLGPSFAANRFTRQTFDHAGGEIIFNLPNGLQGYLLVDSKGNRIDIGPPDIVSDSLKTAGSAEVVNGLSCMSCHRDGMRRFKDTVRSGSAVSGGPREKVERLYRQEAEMNALLDKDEARFVKALDAATGGFLKVAEDSGKTAREFPEPVGALTRSYLKDLGPEEVAADLGLKGVDELATLLRGSASLRRLALGPLLQEKSIKRSQWDSLTGRLTSTFQEAARELQLGTPFRVF